jgi:hypothetical protein
MKVSVTVKEVWDHIIEVEVPDNATKEQILEAANVFISKGDEGRQEYSYTLEPDMWTVVLPNGNYI